MRSVKSLEDALADARVLGGEYDTLDTAAARRRITKDTTRTRWNNLFAQRLPNVLNQRQCGDTGIAGPDAPRRPESRHAQAARDLYALSSLVIHDHAAAHHITRFANNRRIEPDGALILACLLDLAEREEAAQFWWQFAAGAGSALSAQCLYLMHLRRGETRDAEHWAQQAAQLDLHPVKYRLRAPEEWAQAPTANDSVTTLCASRHTELHDAVSALPVTCDDDYGQIPQPDPTLAHHLAVLAAAG